MGESRTISIKIISVPGRCYQFNYAMSSSYFRFDFPACFFFQFSVSLQMFVS